MNFRMGDTVRLMGASVLVGKIVEIVANEINANRCEVLLGIEFEEKVTSGHSCRNHGIDGHCLYVQDYKVEKVGD